MATLSDEKYQELLNCCEQVAQILNRVKTLDSRDRSAIQRLKKVAMECKEDFQAQKKQS